MKPIAPEKKKRFKKAVGNVINYEGESYDPHNCAICRGTFEELADEVAFKYLLRVFKMTSETAMKLIRGDILNNGAKI